MSLRCTHLTVCSLSQQAVTFDPNTTMYRLILWFLSHILMRLMKKKNKTTIVWKLKLYLHVNIKLLYHMYRATGVHRITINTPDDTEVSWIFFSFMDIKKYMDQEPPYLMRQICALHLQWEEIKTRNSGATHHFCKFYLSFLSEGGGNFIWFR